MEHKNNKLKSKKAMATTALIGIVISLLSMYIVSDYIFSTSNIVSTQAEDLKCRQLLNLKESSGYKIFNFFSDLNTNCVTEEYEIDSKEKTDQFKQIANSMSKCWYRYGEGELDFLSNFNTEGSWCFTCAKLSFEEKGNIYPYSTGKDSFVEWTKNNKINTKDGQDLTYHNYMNLKYVNNGTSSAKELKSLIADLEETTVESDGLSQPIINALYEKNIEIFDLAQKEINTNENLFIVYRYDRIPKSQMELLTDVGIGFGVGFAAETVLVAGAGIVLAPFTGGTSLILTAGAVTKAGIKAKNAYKVTASILKFNKIIDKIGDTIKLSRLKRATEVLIKGGELTVKATTKVVNKLPTEYKKFGEHLLDIAHKLEEAEVRTFHELSDKARTSQDTLNKFHQMTDKAIDDNMLNSNAINKLVEIEKSKVTQKNKLLELQDKIKNVDISTLTTTKEKEEWIENAKNYMSGVKTLSIAAAGAIINGEQNSNYIQYVDALNQEQYYRLCGPEPITN